MITHTDKLQLNRKTMAKQIPQESVLITQEGILKLCAVKDWEVNVVALNRNNSKSFLDSCKGFSVKKIYLYILSDSIPI